MNFNDYCPLKKSNISEAECIEIVAELHDLKTEEHMKKLRKKSIMSNLEMLTICKECPNYVNF